MIGRMRADGVRTVVWVTPWSTSSPPTARAPRRRSPSECTSARPPTTPRGDGRALRRARRAASPFVGALVDGHGLADRLHLHRGAALVEGAGARRARDGRRGDQGRRRRGLLLPAGGRLRRRAHRRRGGVGLRPDVPGDDAGGPRRGPPRRGGPVRALRLDRPAGDRDALGRRPGLGLLVAAHPGGRDADRRGERLLELVARRRRLPGQAAGRTLPARAAAPLGPVRLLLAPDAGPRALRSRRRGATTTARSTTYREYVLLHERLVPYIRAAAATCERSGLPIIRPLCLTDPADPRGWEIADAYGFGPALWVAPVLEEGAAEREVYLPRGEWIDFWTREPIHGGRSVVALSPRERIPVWVRSGSIVLTHPAETRRLRPRRHAGGPTRPSRRASGAGPCWDMRRRGRADGTEVRWERGEWSCSAEGRELRYAEHGV